MIFKRREHLTTESSVLTFNEAIIIIQEVAMKKTLIILSALLIPSLSPAYPGGTLMYVTDMVPACASCHSAAKAEYMPELPPEVAEKETAEYKHYGLVRMPAPPSPYMELTDDQKEKVIREAKNIDTNSSISITAPARVKKGEDFKVSIKVKGGDGPVICVMLVDRPLRFQARPASSEGWMILDEPVVKGQDGKVQTAWFDKRIKGLKRNLNFTIIMDEKLDLEKGIFPTGEIVYTLKAPSTSGTYSLTAAFLYGTENTEKAGFFQRPSGRILFSEEKKVHVE